MYCPYCSNDNSKVIDSRDSSATIRRRRECLMCGLRFTTYERIQTRSLVVVKRDGTREDFDRDKLWASVRNACAKRPLPIGNIDKSVNEIELGLSKLSKAEISSKSIGELVMNKLITLDRVAYIRFASVYRDFRDIENFKDEVDALLEPKYIESDNTQLSFLEDELHVKKTKKRGRKPKNKTMKDVNTV
jgi:transcriptional repressor NrdR